MSGEQTRGHNPRMSLPSPTKRPTEAWRSKGLFEGGMGQVVVARFKGSGEAELGVFLLDVFCLGVKNAFYTRSSAFGYEAVLNRIFQESDSRTELTPACARRLVEGAVAYAGGLGIPPHEDYKLGCRLFGGIDPSECGESFTFGREGKPEYIQGPNDSPRFAENVLRCLRKSCGEGNYHFMVLG